MKPISCAILAQIHEISGLNDEFLMMLEILEAASENLDLAVLTEESPDTGERMTKPAFWSVDPMDGTLAFINNTPGFSVSVECVLKA